MSETRLSWDEIQSLARVDVPVGYSPAGRWLVKRVVCTDSEASFNRMKAAFHGSNRAAPPGRYTNLLRVPRADEKGRRPHESWWTIVMSDTPDEIRDHWDFIEAARGQVLIHGLGIGCALGPIMAKSEVERVTVIEIDPDLIALIGPHYRERFGDRLEIVCADALAWQPPRGTRYGAVWHDIWDAICSDNIEDMKRLHRRYAKRCDWQGSWAREECEYQRRAYA